MGWNEMNEWMMFLLTCDKKLTKSQLNLYEKNNILKPQKKQKFDLSKFFWFKKQKQKQKA